MNDLATEFKPLPLQNKFCLLYFVVSNFTAPEYILDQGTEYEIHRALNY